MRLQLMNSEQLLELQFGIQFITSWNEYFTQKYIM